jgi:ATP-dependent RNA helicase DHX36
LNDDHDCVISDQGGDESGEGGEGGGRGRRRGRPPPGLKGREIGLWYAQKSKKKKEEMERLNVCAIFV